MSDVARTQCYHEESFYASEDLVLYFGQPLLKVGDAALGEQIRSASAHDGFVRYPIAWQVHLALSKLFILPTLETPVNNIWVQRDDSQYFVVHLCYLPGFTYPARIVRLKCSKEGDTPDELFVSEFWFSKEKELQAINPSLFLENYKILAGDENAFRHAVYEILQRRLSRAPEGAMPLFLEKDAGISL